MITPEHLALINRQTQREFTAAELFAFKVSACDNDIDRDGEAITIDGLVELSVLYEGKTVLVDHSPKAENQKARIYKTEVETVPGKLSATGDPLARLVAFCYMLRTESNKDFIVEIEAGIKKEVSIGCSCRSVQCSICGANHRDGYCEHRKGKRYENRICYHSLSDFTDAYEISFVAVPAQKNAGVTKKYNNIKKRGEKLMGIEFLQNKIRRITSDIEAKSKQMERVDSVDTYKSLDLEVKELEADRDAMGDLLAKMLNQDRQDQQDGAKKAFDPLASFRMGSQQAQDDDDDDYTNSKAYRKSFMQFVVSGTPIPADVVKADQSTTTPDVATAIPTVLVNRIVEKMKSLGMILPLVTHTAIPAGIEIPTSNVRPKATWVGEGKGSDKQKKNTGKIQFTSHKLRCEISMSMEVHVMAISAFEDAFVSQVAEAMVEAKEQAIISGSGSGQPKGILTETPADGQALTAKALSYQLLVDAEAALPQAYDNGAVWCMTKKTYMSFIGMVDENGQPIARTNYGIAGAPERALLGRTVVLCGDYMKNFSATLETGAVFAFLFKFSDYALNKVYNMGIQRKPDWDDEDILTKAVESCDGKVLDKNSLVTIAKSA